MANQEKTRVWIDACFDLFHYGHANALRRASKMGDVLVVGVVADAPIWQNKRLTILNEKERAKMAGSVRWGDEVVENCAWNQTPATLRALNCRFALHGDDVSVTATGENSYAVLIEADMYRTFPRTIGISTSDIIQRAKNRTNDKSFSSSQLLHYAETLEQFLDDAPNQNDSELCAYVRGSWDLFHPGSVDFLEGVRAKARFIVVGILSDEDSEAVEGHRPVLNVFERALAVAANKNVGQVIIDAPITIVPKCLDAKIDFVCAGKEESTQDDIIIMRKMADICGATFETITTGNPLTTQILRERIEELDTTILLSENGNNIRNGL